MVERVSAPTRRLFFALWPSEEQRERIAVASAPAVESSRGRPVSHANLHVTVLFLGAVPEDRVPAVLETASGASAAPVGLVFDRLETWPGANVLCLTCTQPPAELTHLHTQLRTGLTKIGFEVREQPFSAHITLARDVRARRRPQPFEPLHWPASEFVLVQSNMTKTGSQYAVIATWPLGARSE